MNISLQDVSNVSAVLTARIEKTDYQERVEKELKTLRQKLNMPGFRKGMVPMGIIRKQYGVSVLLEEVDKLLQEKVGEYIRENKVNMLGTLLPKENNADFKTDENFEFSFDIALAPEFSIELSGEDTVDYYDIDVTDDMVEQQVRIYAQRNSRMDKVEDYQEGDMMKGLLTELDESGNAKEDGIWVEGAFIMPSFLKDDGQKALFDGAKVNTVLVFNPSVAFADSKVEISSLLKISKDEVDAHKGDFSFRIDEIAHIIPGELNQKLFDQVLGEGKASNEEEFRAQIKDAISAQYVAVSDYKFLIDLRTYTLGKVGKLEFADNLMKRIMLENNKEKGEEYVNENYEKSLEELIWHLIKEKLLEANGIKVEPADIQDMAKKDVRDQFSLYGMINVPDDLLESYSKNMLQKPESVENLVNKVLEAKLAATVKTQVTLNHKPISVEDFNKMFQ